MSQDAADAEGPPSSESTGYRAYVLAILVLVYTFNFLDRQIIGILAIPIQAELGVSDGQLGLMRGVSFAIFYSTLGVPIAWLADRTSRVWIMTAALTVWSGMTALCGFTQNAVQLFFARMFVGVGEAGGVAPAYSLVSDYFPPEQRARALAIYSFGIPIGSAVGIIFGGVIAAILDWRAAFIIVGVLGVLLAPLFRLTMREPKRGRFDPPAAPGAKRTASIVDVVKTLSGKWSFWTLCVGAAFSSMMGYGLFAWLPAFFVRSHEASLLAFLEWLPDFMIPEGIPQARALVLAAAYFYGTIVFFGGLAGIWLGGFLADKLGAKNKSMYAVVPGLAFLFVAPFTIVGVLSPSLLLTFFVLLVPTALSLAWLGPTLSAFQHVVPPNMRATASSLFLLINNLIGIGLGDLFLGVISDLFAEQHGAESLRYSILTGSGFYVVAGVFFLISAKRLARDWIS